MKIKKSLHDYIPVSGKVYDQKEIDNAIEAAKDAWWTEGRFVKEFERKFRNFMGRRYVSLVNSGSSANLIALYSLTSSVFKDRALQKGDEFITAAVGFPTTVNPGIQFGLKPVFVDIDIKTLNMDIDQMEKAITPRTKLIMMAHTLGIPFDLERVQYLAKKHNLWIIEDSCDALGSRYNGQLVGTFGDIATYSFYPAHQMTMGEGGAIICDNPLIHRSVRQFRDWGRDCWCDTGKDNTCGRRFDWKMGDLPQGYDHKYIYSQIGFNVKLTDFQAAIGVAQIDKVPGFITARKRNYKKLHTFFSKYPEFFQLIELSEKEDPCWFGCPVIVKKDSPFTRNELTHYLEDNNIGTRNVFAGNLLRHPAYMNLKSKRIVGKMKNADIVMSQAFWLGVWPGLTPSMLKRIINVIELFLSKY
jgi:CDP-6-deoxy-D-xylo-4-hexulose-3-dehydrase